MPYLNVFLTVSGFKIDCNQVYHRSLLAATLRMSHPEKEVIYIPRMNLHYDSNGLYVWTKSPVSVFRDHWLTFKTPKLSFTMSQGIEEKTGQRYAYELLAFRDRIHIDRR